MGGIEKGKTYNILALNTICFSPGTHNERIIVRNGGDDVDALGAEVLEVGDVAGEMGGAAGGGEGAGDGEDDDFFVGPFCGREGGLAEVSFWEAWYGWLGWREGGRGGKGEMSNVVRWNLRWDTGRRGRKETDTEWGVGKE
jgi:hypothetical protein